jgi:acyl-CoA dehydrogenase
VVPHPIFPLAFSGEGRSAGADVYLHEPLARFAAEFFERQGLAAIKDADLGEQWYHDWLAFQTSRRLYARLLTPETPSSKEWGFDLLRYARFLEVCAYFSPSHGYSLHVTFLGLCAILMGDNPELKREALASLETGGLLAFGVSERAHGSDLLANEFTVAETQPGRFTANGGKYYIGNANSAAIIAILARKESRRGADHGRRAAPVLFALRPAQSTAFAGVQKIRTLGVRAAFVGGFDVKGHEFPASDVFAEGRRAWDAIFGAVTLGKFFLGFGSIGICEHAFQEAVAHLRARVLYGKPALDMPHLQATMVQAYARLTAMKLFAYRALDYVHASTATDRRYHLFAAVQKAKLSTEGVKVMALLSECIGARGFESDTYFEMALRDAQLIPGLEGSTHINLGLTAQFIPNYFADPDPSLVEPPSLVAGEAEVENCDLLSLPAGSPVSAIRFPGFLDAYRPLMRAANVRLFAQAAKAFQLFVRRRDLDRKLRADDPATLALGHCQATIAYAQLVAENAARLDLPAPTVVAMFHALVSDLNAAAITLASCHDAAAIGPTLWRRMVTVPRTTPSECSFVALQMAGPVDSGGRSGGDPPAR